jgi:hypothetical protein
MLPAPAPAYNDTASMSAETLRAMTSPASHVVKAFNTTLNDTVSACHSEAADFIQRRWHENLQLTSRLMSCRSIPEIHGAYTDYWQRTAEQYGNEYRQFFSILNHH